MKNEACDPKHLGDSVKLGLETGQIPAARGPTRKSRFACSSLTTDGGPALDAMRRRQSMPRPLIPPRKPPELLGFYMDDSPFAKRADTFRADKRDQSEKASAARTKAQVYKATHKPVVADHYPGRKWSMSRAHCPAHKAPISELNARQTFCELTFPTVEFPMSSQLLCRPWALARTPRRPALR